VTFGFWLSRAGRPYNGLRFNIHKLVALAVVIVTGIQLYRLAGSADPSLFLIVVFALAVLCVVALFVSGAMMSAGKLDHARMRTIHRIAPVILGGAIVLSAYL
jgi:hypothetical protein